SCGTRFALGGAAVALLAASAPAPRSDLRIPIAVFEDAGIARSAEPIVVGIPLPAEAGVLDPAALRLEDATGRTLPAQFWVLARWDAAPGDATAPVRWALLRAVANLPAGGPAALTVRGGRPGSAPPDLSRERS